MAFGHVESVTHMQVLDSDPGGDSSGSPSLHISSASEEGDFPSESSAPRSLSLFAYSQHYFP